MTGEEFRDARKLMRLTQAQLAAELGISRNAVHRYEHGSRPISRATQLALQVIGWNHFMDDR
jgi:transcriptional regulator with XRE-family HTH domain